MINVTDAPVDVEEMRLWANGYRELHTPPLSWKQFGLECGIPQGTLQPFCAGKYQGDNDRIAREIFRFMQSVESRKEHQQSIPTDPGYFETPSSLRIRTLLQIAHMGRITIAATGPGTGKTVTIKDYAHRAAPVWVATMWKSDSRLNAMVNTVLRALGVEQRATRVSDGSRTVANRLQGRSGLLVIDEAQHLELECFEEIRGWHDATGVGVCFLGNEELLARIETGRQRDGFGRLNRRIAHRHVQRIPLEEDVEVFCDAWQLTDPGIRKYLNKIALTPGVGGLGECQMLIEAGSMLAASEDRGLTLADLRDAQTTRATRWIVA